MLQESSGDKARLPFIFIYFLPRQTLAGGIKEMNIDYFWSGKWLASISRCGDRKTESVRG